MGKTMTTGTAEAIKARDPKFINLGELYLARRAATDGEPRFVMELSGGDLQLLLLSLSELLPEDMKLANLQGEELDDETLGRMHALGDSARELLIRATQQGHNHCWHCLVGGVGNDATAAETAMSAYASEVVDERSDETDALQAANDSEPDLDEESPSVTLGPNGVTVPYCGTLIDT